MAGLPLWPSAEGPSYFPTFLNAIGAFLTIQLGCGLFLIAKAEDLPVTFRAGLDGCADETFFKSIMNTARAMLIIALTPNKQATQIVARQETYRDAMMALYEKSAGDCESEVLRDIQRMLQIMLSRGHTCESAFKALTLITDLVHNIRRLDATMSFTEHQLIGLLSLFARNSECNELVMHEQILRQIRAEANNYDLAAVFKHLLASFPTGTGTSLKNDDAPFSELSANATTRGQPRTQINNRPKGGRCFKCTKLISELPTGHVSYSSSNHCIVVPICTLCDKYPGSHDTSLCAEYHKFQTKRRNDRQHSSGDRAQHHGGRRAESALPMSHESTFMPYDNDGDLFYRSGSSATSAHSRFFNDDEDDSVMFHRTGASATFAHSHAILQQRSLTSVERGTSSQHNNTTTTSPFAHYIDPVRAYDGDNIDYLENDTFASSGLVIAPRVFTFVRAPYGLMESPTVAFDYLENDIFASSGFVIEPQVFTFVRAPYGLMESPAVALKKLQRPFTSIERGTSMQHANTTNRSPFAHLSFGLDSMCWHHFVGDIALLVNIRKLCNEEMQRNATRVASGSQVCPTHCGDLPLILRTSIGAELRILITKVLYAAQFDNLISVGQLRSESNKASLPTFEWRDTEGTLRFRFPGMSNWVEVPHVMSHNCYYLVPISAGAQCFSSKKAAAVLPRQMTITSAKAQQRLGFINPRSVAMTIANTLGITLSDNPLKLPMQEATLHGMKTAGYMIKGNSNVSGGTHVRRHWTTMRYETLHIDLHGPYMPGFINNATFFMSYTSNFGVTWVTFLKSSKSADIILQTKEAFTRLGTPRHIRTDNSMTLLNHDPATATAFNNFLVEHDVAIKISAPNAQWQNGCAERTGGRTVYEHATSMLFDAGLGKQWWPFAVAHYADLSNFIALPKLQWKTPTEAHFGFKPTIAHLRRFGCPAFFHVNKKLRESPAAFSSRVQRGIHVGNATDSKLGVYLLYNLETKKLVKTMSLYFDENFDIVKKGPRGWEFQPSLLDAKYSKLLFRQTDIILPPEATDFRVSPMGLTSASLHFISDEADDEIIATSTQSPSLPSQEHTAQPVPLVSDPPEPVPSQQSSSVDPSNILSGQRRRNQVTRINLNPHPGGDAQWQDNAASAGQQVEIIEGLTIDDQILFQSASMASPAPTDASLQYLKQQLPVHTVAHIGTVLPPPLTVRPEVDFDKTSPQIKRFIIEHGDAGRAAFDAEITGMMNAKVLSIPVDLPPGHRAPPATMLCTQKADGRVKARMVYRGDLQIEGINYDATELYAPVMDKSSFRLLLAIGAAHHAHIHTLDVNLAFLYGEMEDELYMKPPLGISLPYGKVWRVLKSLYGTKQAPAIWHKVLKKWLDEQGLKPTQSDACVFIKREGSSFFFVGVHVDDLLMISTSASMLADFKVNTTKRFSFKDQGELNEREFTGCYVQYDRQAGRVTLSCDRSVLKLLELTGFDNASPHRTPISKQQTRDTTEDKSELASLFGSISGHANWQAGLCRPDLSLTSSTIASYNWQHPTVSDVKDSKRLLRYLKGRLHTNPNFGITYSADSYDTLQQALTPVSFADSDHAGDPAGGPTTKRSRSGYCIFFCGGLICWRSKLQQTIATSTTFAEIIALSDLCKQLVWVIALITELGFPQKAVPVYEDNQPAIDSILANRNSTRTRHYEIRYFWVRELADDRKIIELHKVPTKLNYSDFWTKILPGGEMIAAINSFMLTPLHKRFHPSS